MQEKPARQPKGANPSNSSPSEQQQIAIAIDALKRSYDTSENNRQKHDRESLKWTRRTAKAAIAYTVVTALLLAAGIYSTIQAWRAVDAANRSAEAAKDSVTAANRAADAAAAQTRIAEDTEKHQLRAYAYAKPPPQGVQNVVAGGKVLAVIAVRNSGQTPAYHLRMRGNTGVGVWPIPSLQTWREGPYGGNLVLNPETETTTGGKISSDVDTITQPDIESVHDGKTHRLYVFGTILYEDIFGSERYSDFCFAYYGDGPILTTMEYCEIHNNAN